MNRQLSRNKTIKLLFLCPSGLRSATKMGDIFPDRMCRHPIASMKVARHSRPAAEGSYWGYWPLQVVFRNIWKLFASTLEPVFSYLTIHMDTKLRGMGTSFWAHYSQARCFAKTCWP